MMSPDKALRRAAERASRAAEDALIVARYRHGEASIRQIARDMKVYPSTVLRRMRRAEAGCTLPAALPSDKVLDVLKRLSQPGAQLVVAPDMPNAIIAQGEQTVMKVDRGAFTYFRDFGLIQIISEGRVSIYQISIAGLLLIEGRNKQLPRRVNLSELPLERLGHPHSGEPAYLDADLVRAGQRIRDEYRHMDQGLSSVLYWQQVATGRPIFPNDAGAFLALDPDLAAIVLLVCCCSVGIEEAERSLGWPARSGRLVLRIALKRLAAHYRIVDADQAVPVERQEERLIAAGDLVVNPEQRTIHANGQQLPVSQSQYEMLLAMIERDGRPMSVAELSAAVEDQRGRDGPTEMSVVVSISKIRKHLKSAGSRAEIKTVRSVGYRLEAVTDRGNA